MVPQVSTSLMHVDIFATKNMLYSRKYFNTMSITTMILQYRQLVELNVSTILNRDTLSLFTTL